MNQFIKKLLVVLSVFNIFATVPVMAEEAPKEVDLILDWVPNTNHTGLYVAQEKGFFEEAGVKLNLRRPPEGSSTELVGLGKAQFGISFQDSLAKRFAGGVPVTAIAAIIEHNTSGILATKESNIKAPQDLAGHKYGTWNDPIELKTIEYIVTKAGAKFEDVKLVPNDADNSVVALANKQFDAAWIFYAWDGIMAGMQNVETNYFHFRDVAPELDFYSPVIIANNDYLAAHPEQAKMIIQAIKKGYQYAIENPEESAEILIKAAPELEEMRDVVVKSQEWISKQYAENPEKWGEFSEERWNTFYKWLYDNKLVDVDLTTGKYFTNEFVGAN